MSARRVAVLAVLGAALAVAAVALATTGIRLATAPRDVPHPPPFASPSASGSTSAFARLDLPQTDEDRRAAAPLERLPGLPEVAKARLLGRPDGLVVVGWMTDAGEVCLSAYRSGPGVEPVSACAMRGDFAAGGIALRWPDSPDLGPFEIRWSPEGGLDLTSARPPGGIPVTPPPTAPTSSTG